MTQGDVMRKSEALPGVGEPDVGDGGHPRAVHTRTTVLGLLIVAGALAFVGVRLSILGVALAEVAPLLVFLVVALVVAGLAWRFGTWAKVLGAVVALALLAMYVPFIILEIQVPQSFFDFAPIYAALVGSLTAIIGGIAAVVKRRDRRVGASPAERRVAAVVLVGLAAGLALSGVLTLTSRTAVTAGERAGAEDVVMHDYEFTAASYQATAGATTFLVSNRDSSWHSFTIDELGIDMRVLPGSEALVEIPASAPAGTYTLYCIPHSTVSDGQREGMVATFEVAGAGEAQ